MEPCSASQRQAISNTEESPEMRKDSTPGSQGDLLTLAVETLLSFLLCQPVHHVIERLLGMARDVLNLEKVSRQGGFQRLENSSKTLERWPIVVASNASTGLQC